MMSDASMIVQDWYRTGDPALLAPDIEWRVLERFPSGGVYRGRDEVLDCFFPAVKANFASYETHPQTFVAEGDTVIATGIYRVRGRSGIAVDAAFAHVWTVRDGVISGFRQIADTAAIDAARRR